MLVLEAVSRGVPVIPALISHPQHEGWKVEIFHVCLLFQALLNDLAQSQLLEIPSCI